MNFFPGRISKKCFFDSKKLFFRCTSEYYRNVCYIYILEKVSESINEKSCHFQAFNAIQDNNYIAINIKLFFVVYYPRKLQTLTLIVVHGKKIVPETLLNFLA